MPRFFSVLLHVVAGYVLFMLCGFAFVRTDEWPRKMTITGVVAVIAGVFLLLGLAVSGFRTWRRDAGIVLLLAAGFTAFTVLSMVCVVFTPELADRMRPDTIAFFSDYVAGGETIAVLAILGGFLLRSSQREDTPPHAPSTGINVRRPRVTATRSDTTKDASAEPGDQAPAAATPIGGALTSDLPPASEGGGETL